MAPTDVLEPPPPPPELEPLVSCAWLLSPMELDSTVLASVEVMVELPSVLTTVFS